MLPRSPKITGEPRSPWAIKKIAKLREVQPVYSERLEYEAGILKTLKHPNIVGYRAFSKKGESVLAMEMGSQSLSDLMESRMEEKITENLEFKPFPVKHILKVALDIASALKYLHEKMKMIHGDLKSGNVLIFGDFQTVKLCDFGVSRKLNKDGTIQGDYVGTQLWSAMEVILYEGGKASNFSMCYTISKYA